jgi:hypothetical protein
MMIAFFIGIAVPVLMSTRRKGYRNAYFAAAFVTLLLAVGCNAMSGTSRAALGAMTDSERHGVELVEQISPAAFSLYFGLFIGSVVGGLLFRTHPPLTPLRPCPHCAETIQAAAVFCRFCGRNVPAGPTPAAHPDAQPIDRGWRPLYFLLITIAVVGVSVAVSQGPRKTGANTTQRVTAERSQIQKIEEMPPAALRGQLRRIVLAKGFPCRPSGGAAFRQGQTTAGDVVWNYSCIQDGNFSIRFVNSPDESVEVVRCEGVKLTTGLECFRTFEEQAK